MEDEPPPKESHLWTLSDFIERRKNWDQSDELRLAEYLQQLSDKITQGANNTLKELNEVVASVDETAVQVANISNEFQLLADKQFIENKVQEEDETVQVNNDKKPVAHKTNNTDTLVNHYKEALKHSFEAIDTYFEKITVIVSDSDDDDDDNKEIKHKETILRPRTFYKKLNLPSLNGDTHAEPIIETAMSAESDSDVEQPRNTFKDEESVSSNDAPEENIDIISESKSLHKPVPNPEPTDIFSNIVEPEKVKPTPFSDNVPVDDLFSPPPLPNDNDEDEFDNEYNIFGNGNSNMYSERNLWDDNEEDDFLNESPLPIYSDEPPSSLYSHKPPLPTYSDQPPQQVIKSSSQEKVETPSIHQSLNDELRKRFQKDNTSLSDTSNIESPKIKLPKGAVNILGGTDTKPYITVPAQNLRQSAIPQINKNTVENTQNSYADDVRKDSNISSLMSGDSSQNIISNTNINLKKETSSIKKRTLFEQDSDDEDLFAGKPSNVLYGSKLEVTNEKEKLTKSDKPSRTIFSESDSDEEFFNSKPNTSKTGTHTNIDHSSSQLLNPSSDDDFFNSKSPKQKSTIPSTQVKDKESINTNVEKEQESKSLDTQKNTIEVLNKHIIDIQKNCSEKSSILNDKTNSHNIQRNRSNQHFTDSQHLKKSNNLFSSDEDEFDDSSFFNVKTANKNNQKSSKKEEITSSSSNLGEITNNSVLNVPKMSMFDSSSDDDIFNTNESNNFKSSKNSRQSDSKEVKNIEKAKLNDNQNVINLVKKTEIIDESSSIEKNVEDEKNIKNFFSSSDDNDDSYLSFDKTSDGIINLSNSQNENDSKSCLSSEVDLKDSVKIVSPEHKVDGENHKLTTKNEEDILTSNMSDKEEIDTLKKETTPISNDHSVLNDESSLFSSGTHKQQLSIDSKIKIENSLQNSSSIIHQKSVSSIESKELIKDSVDGSLFSSQKETTKKLPGKLNRNAGAFINIKGLLPSSKSPLKKLDTPHSVSLDENNENSLPTSGAKLFSAEKERARIQVKRRPQSRKARQVAARMSSIDIGHESNFQESSRLFGSTSDLFDYQSSPILNDDVGDFSDKVENKIQTPSNNALFARNEKDNEKTDLCFKSKNKLLDLFDDDSDPFESTVEVTSPNEKKEISSNDNESDQQIVNEKVSKTETKDKKQPILESVSDKQTDVETVFKVETENRINVSDIKKVEKNKSEIDTQSTSLSTKKSESLFGDDSDKFESFLKEATQNIKKEKSLNSEHLEKEIADEQLLFKKSPVSSKHPDNESALKTETEKQFSVSSTAEPDKTKSISSSLFDDDDSDFFSLKSKKEKNLPSSSNIFDSDDELDFSQSFAKKNLAKTKSIFGDDSDDDLFSTPSKPSTSNLPPQKPIDKSSQRLNRPIADGYVKLTAESVAINPLESKKD